MNQPELTQKANQNLTKVIVASSLGTLIEWYDFYLYGALSPIIAKQFFPSENPTAAFLAALATFAAGFVVRPFGALVFGRIGDRMGRKYTFLLTLVLMGFSTFAIGLVPSYAKIGAAAPFLILALRLIQGLALGGEYGGAATYVAEFSPKNRRGFYTSFIQTTATVGFFLSLVVILLTKKSLGDVAFNDWGWRVPFWISAIMIGVSVYIRLKMSESPLFFKLKSAGNISQNPLRESFTQKRNLKMVLLALFGAVMGQGVVWYTGQFYAQTFIERTCSVEFEQTRYIMMIAIAGGTLGFVFFGWLSDKIGRKWIMLAGMLLAVLTYRPIYQLIYEKTDAKKVELATKNFASEAFSHLQIISDSTFLQTANTTFETGNTFKLIQTIKFSPSKQAEKIGVLQKIVWLSSRNFWFVSLLVFLQIMYVTMVYGPIAAFLVELFPTRIRYTSMSLPYHIGNGIFGGLTPLIATRLFDVSKTAENPDGDPFIGLWYPIIVAAICFVIGVIYLPNRSEENREN